MLLEDLGHVGIDELGLFEGLLKGRSILLLGNNFPLLQNWIAKMDFNRTEFDDSGSKVLERCQRLSGLLFPHLVRWFALVCTIETICSIYYTKCLVMMNVQILVKRSPKSFPGIPHVEVMHCHTQGRPDCDDDVEGLYNEDDDDDKDDDEDEDDDDLLTVLVCGAMFVLSARLFRGCLQFVFVSDLFPLHLLKIF